MELKGVGKDRRLPGVFCDSDDAVIVMMRLPVSCVSSAAARCRVPAVSCVVRGLCCVRVSARRNSEPGKNS